MSQKFKVLLRSFIIGIVAFFSLLLVYFLLVGLVESWKHAQELFLTDAFFIGAISLGFGIQVGLYSYIKQLQKIIAARKITAAAVSGTGTSTISMVACCLHHVGDVLPLIGLSGAVLFFEQYRYLLMWFGIIINTVGILMIIRLIAKNRLWPKQVFNSC